MARAFVLLLYSIEINTTISIISMNIMHNHALSPEKYFGQYNVMLTAGNHIK